MPRIVMLMGSGETSPTMVKSHREVFSTLPKDAPSFLLDTPFGFQGNAEDICRKAIAYFQTSVGRNVQTASMRDHTQASSLELETFANQLRQAQYLFAGPGSPTYALKQWSQLPVATILREKVVTGGAIAFSSAAVLTLGRHTIPVYEIYKVGEAPQLQPGLDVLGAIGLNALVIPHFNNAEGQNHDTRFCFMGQERLEILLGQMDEGCAAIGIDEHTAIIMDLDAETVRIEGRGGVSVLSNRGGQTLESGQGITLDEFRSMLASVIDGQAPARARTDKTLNSSIHVEAQTESPLMDTVEILREAFDKAICTGNSHEALAAILDLEAEIAGWGADTTQSDELDKARAQLRSMVSSLEPIVSDGMVSEPERLAPYVETILALRGTARADKRWNDADLIRDKLDELGIVVQDTPEGAVWTLAQGAE